MRMRATWLTVGILLVASASLLSCRRVPGGNWRIETGRARMTDDQGERRVRMEAVGLAQRDAQIKLLEFVEAMPMPGSTFVGDCMVQNSVIGACVRSLVLSAPQFAVRYTKDETVEVDMGVNLDEVRRTVGERTP